MRNDQIPMDRSLNFAVSVNHLLQLNQIVKASFYRKMRKFPLYHAGKPDECTHIIKYDWAIRLLCLYDMKTRKRKTLILFGGI